MADFQTTIELKAEARQLETKLAAIKTKLKGISTQVSKTQGRFKRFSTKVTGSLSKINTKLKSNKTAVLAVGASLGLMVGKGVKDLKEWEDGLAQIETLGVTGLDEVGKSLDKIRKKYGITGAEATKGYYDIISAGASQGSEALDQLVAATKLAKAGNTDLAGAIDVVTSGINIFGDNGETATSIVDQLFLAVKFGKTTVKELGQTFGFVAPVVDAAGLSMADYAAAMAAVTAGGIQTKQATTGIKAVLSNLIKVTPKAKKQAAALGIEFSAAALKSKGFVGVMQDIADKTGGDVTLLGKLFDSIEAINTVAVLTSKGGLKNLGRNFDAMSDSAGTTDVALSKVEDTASFNFGKFNQSMSIMSRSIGSAVVPGLLKLAEAFAPVVDFFAELIKQEPGLILAGLAIAGVVASIAFLGGPVTLGIIALGLAFKTLWEYFGGGEEGGASVLDKMSLAWDNLWTGLKDEDGEVQWDQLGEMFGKAISGALGKLGTWIKEAFDKIVWMDVLKSLGDGFLAVIKFTIGLIGGLFGDIDFSGMGTSIKDAFMGAVKAAMDWMLSKIPSWLGGTGGDGETDYVFNQYGKKGGGSEQTAGATNTVAKVAPGTKPTRKAEGGEILGAGTGTSDSIPAMLSNGEFVMNAASTKKFMPLLEAMNKNKMATGGPVGNTASGGYSADTTRILASLSEVVDYFSAGDLAESLDSYMNLDHVEELFNDFVADFSANDFAEILNDQVSKIADIDLLDAMNENLLEFINDAGHELEYFEEIPAVVDQLTKSLENISGSEEVEDIGSDDLDRLREAFQQYSEDYSRSDISEQLDDFTGSLDNLDTIFENFVADFSAADLSESLDNISGSNAETLLDNINESFLDYVSNWEDYTSEWGESLSATVAKVASPSAGIVGPHAGGNTSDSNNYLQFTNGLFDAEATMAKFVTQLDQGSAAVQLVKLQMAELGKWSGNLSQAQILEHQYAIEINESLARLIPEKKKEVAVIKEANSALKDFSKVATESKMKMTNEFEGFGSSFTGPIKQAMANGGSIGDAFKAGARSLFQKLANKFLDKAFEPLEKAIDEGLNSLFSNLSSQAMSGGGGGIGGFFSSLFGGGGMGGGSSAGGGIGRIASGLFGGLMMAKGGIVPKPQYLASGGFAKGTDTVPAMLTPGEMVLNKDQQDMLGGSATYNTYNLEISGNVDQRAIEQIRNIIQNSPNQVNQASNRGERERTGLRPSNRR